MTQIFSIFKRPSKLEYINIFNVFIRNTPGSQSFNYKYYSQLSNQLTKIIKIAWLNQFQS